MTRRTFLPHPVEPEWRGRVRDELKRRGRGSQAKLLEFINAQGVECSSGQLTDILNGKYQTSAIVELVHEHFGWVAPMPPTASLDAGELAHLGARMTKEQRELMARAAAIVDGKSGEDARKALVALIDAMSPKSK